MVTPTNLYLWLSQQAWPAAIICSIILVTYVAAHYSAASRRRELTRKREGVSEESFAEYLTQFGFDPVIAAATYRYLQQVQRVDFPILPSDSLDEDLGLGLEEVDQTVNDLTAALKREWNPGLAHAPLVTVEDLIRLIQASPRIASYAAA